uniref:Uncharacterized protein n=1 Tax=Arundo donax TaxID=35708 RepID=A0A0A9GV25_ARUDO
MTDELRQPAKLQSAGTKFVSKLAGTPGFAPGRGNHVYLIGF